MVTDAARARHEAVYARVPKPFAWWRVTDRVYAGRNPLTEVDIAELTELGVTHVLDLREPQEWEPPGCFGLEAVEACAHLGIARRNVPIEDGSAPAAADFDAAVSWIVDSLALPDTTLYAHCRAGIERTATILCAWRCREQGEDPETALTALRADSWPARPLPWQRQALEAWLPRRNP